MDNAGFLQHLDEFLSAAIHDGHLFHVDVDEDIIDAQTSERSQDVFNGIYFNTTFSEGGTSCRINDVINVSFDNGLVLKVNATETDARVGRSRIEGQGAALTCVQPCSRYADFSFKSTLSFFHKQNLDS